MAKNTNKSLIFSIFCSTLCSALLSSTLLSTSAYAADTEKVTIEVMNDAKIFAQFDDEIPAVINYFTTSNETSIVNFYEEKFGQAITSNRRKGRLEKSFVKDKHNINIIISEQNNFRQVDVLITNAIN
ncbi:hypothetical protein [Colwellia sp. UCD-KL20]|uniref:hypothetical protein n=1 Tax=Colwellia sp. UCD-KL20 TaxID=1917165 RepID=UPI0009708506|nr:hypothetical protein [Colwellia sp. UCD-KL20]